MAKSQYHQQYYLDNNLDAMIEKTNRRMETLQLLKEIRDINDKLRILRACIGLGTSQADPTKQEKSDDQAKIND